MRLKYGNVSCCLGVLSKNTLFLHLCVNFLQAWHMCRNVRRINRGCGCLHLLCFVIPVKREQSSERFWPLVCGSETTHELTAVMEEFQLPALKNWLCSVVGFVKWAQAWTMTNIVEVVFSLSTSPQEFIHTSICSYLFWRKPTNQPRKCVLIPKCMVSEHHLKAAGHRYGKKWNVWNAMGAFHTACLGICIKKA